MTGLDEIINDLMCDAIRLEQERLLGVDSSGRGHHEIVGILTTTNTQGVDS